MALRPNSGIIVHLTDERVASAELDYLAQSLTPPCQLGSFELTGNLARSATALLFTARGDLFEQSEGVLKLTGTAYAPILRRELALLQQAARAGIDAIVQPLSDDLMWLFAGRTDADRPAAALPLPFLAGGDVGSFAQRASREGSLGPALALAAARPVAEALRGLLTELDRPVVHGDVRAQNLLLPTPDAAVAALTLIDLDAAHDLDPALRATLVGSAALPTEAAALLAADVRGFGDIVLLLSGGPSSGNRPLDHLIDNCLNGQYTSLADSSLWHDLAAAERAALAKSGWLSTLKNLLP